MRNKVAEYTWFGMKAEANRTVNPGFAIMIDPLGNVLGRVDIRQPDSWHPVARSIAFHPDDEDAAFAFLEYVHDVVLKPKPALDPKRLP